VLAVACVQPVPSESVARVVLSGDLQQASSQAPGVEAWEAPLRLWRENEASRGILRAAETQLAIEDARRADAAGDVEGLLTAVRVGLAAAPESSTLTAWVPRIEEVARQREGTGDLRGALTLYEGLATLVAAPEVEAARRERVEELAVRLAITQRYGPAGLADTRSAQQGISLGAALEVLETVHRGFVEEVVLSEWIARSRARVAGLAASSDARQAFPALEDGRMEAWLRERAPRDRLSLSEARKELADLVGAASSRGGVPEEVAVYEIMDAGLGGLDPWSRVIWPQELTSWEQHHQGVYVGVGLVLQVDPAGQVIVEYPQPGSPADVAGLHQGDVIAAVGGEAYADLVGEARRAALEGALLGAESTVVSVRVDRGGEPRSFELARQLLTPDVVTGWQRREDNGWTWWLDEAEQVAYARIVSFRAHTDEALDAALAASNARAVVLDLRGNPGGDVNAAVNVVDRFVAEGTLAQLAGRVPPQLGPDVDPETGEPLVPWNQAIPGHALEGVPVAVLVDRDTASAAELVAGGLQERVDAVVIGERTHGKGLSQVLKTDPAGRYALQFTNLYWTLPSGRRLDRMLAESPGVEPDFADVLTPAEQFWVNLGHRRRGYVRSHADGSPIVYASTVGRDDLPSLSADPHIQRALLMLRARLELADADATGDASDE